MRCYISALLKNVLTSFYLFLLKLVAFLSSFLIFVLVVAIVFHEHCDKECQHHNYIPHFIYVSFFCFISYFFFYKDYTLYTIKLFLIYLYVLTALVSFIYYIFAIYYESKIFIYAIDCIIKILFFFLDWSLFFMYAFTESYAKNMEYCLNITIELMNILNWFFYKFSSIIPETLTTLLIRFLIKVMVLGVLMIISTAISLLLTFAHLFYLFISTQVLFISSIFVLLLKFWVIDDIKSWIKKLNDFWYSTSKIDIIKKWFIKKIKVIRRWFIRRIDIIGKLCALLLINILIRLHIYIYLLYRIICTNIYYICVKVYKFITFVDGKICDFIYYICFKVCDFIEFIDDIINDFIYFISDIIDSIMYIILKLINFVCCVHVLLNELKDYITMQFTYFILNINNLIFCVINIINYIIVSIIFYTKLFYFELFNFLSNFNNLQVIFEYCCFFYPFIFLFIIIFFYVFNNFYSFRYFFIFLNRLNFIFVTLFLPILILINNKNIKINTEFNFFSKINTFFGYEAKLNFVINNVSINLLFLIVIIFTFCFYFSYYYMIKDLKCINFLFFLSLFANFMIFLIISNNVFLLFFFWELIGAFSFVLIGFYKNKTMSFKSAFKAFSFNKFSDSFFFLSILFYIKYKKSSNIFISNNIDNCLIELNFFFFDVKQSVQSLFLLFLVLSAFVKSAQLLFGTWLIDSMDAPAPASALIHSATLVMSGIFLILKFKLELLLYPNIVNFILVSSIITSVHSSLKACFQTDIKRLLAYSTISNCSIIILLIFTNSDFHVFGYIYMHGFIKSILFLIAGIFFFFNFHNQDINNFSESVNLYTSLKIIFIFLLFCLSSMPFSFLYDTKHLLLLNTCFSYNKYTCYLLDAYLLIQSLLSFLYFFNFFFNYNFYDFDKGYKNFDVNHNLHKCENSCNFKKKFFFKKYVYNMYIIVIVFFFFIITFFYFYFCHFNVFSYLLFFFRNFCDLQIKYNNILSKLTIFIFLLFIYFYINFYRNSNKQNFSLFFIFILFYFILF